MGVNEEDPDSILKSFVEAHETQLALIQPDYSTLWKTEFDKDPKKFDQTFV